MNTISTVSECFENWKGSNSRKKWKFGLKIPYKGLKNLILSIRSLGKRFLPPDFGVFIPILGPVNTISTISERFENRKGSNSRKKWKFDLKIPYKGLKNPILPIRSLGNRFLPPDFGVFTPYRGQ